MFQNLKTSVQQFLTATALLGIVLLVLEVVLQQKLPPTRSTVAPTASPETQDLLVPSATTHHEMMRLRSGTSSHFATNSYGLRGEEPAEAPPGLRILVLGDDTVVGSGLRDEETVPSRLEQFLSKATGTQVEVINAGVPGYCPLLSWIQYRHQLRRFQADIVILHFDMSDVSDDVAYRPLYNASGHEPVCSNPSLGHTARPWWLRIAGESAIARSLISDTVTNAAFDSEIGARRRYQWTFEDAPDLRMSIQHAMTPIQLLSRNVRADGAKFVVASSPVPWQLSPRDQSNEESPDRPAPFQIIDSACNSSSTLFCDASTPFGKFADQQKLFTENSQALSPYGAALYAKHIASTLLSSTETASLFSSTDRVSRRVSAQR